MRIAITGATGRMGLELMKAISNQKYFKLSAILVRDAKDVPFKDQLPENILITESIEELVKHTSIVADFSTPRLTMKIAKIAAAKKKPLVSGTTGLLESQWRKLQNIGKTIPILHSSNMSIGVNLMHLLVGELALILDDSFDIELIEKHHRKKIDAPSGTAIMLAKSISNIRKKEWRNNIILSGMERAQVRPKGKIGISSIRAGSIVGDHEVSFCSNLESLSISHQAFDRSVFAVGALKACKWITSQKPGFYSMFDVLKLR